MKNLVLSIILLINVFFAFSQKESTSLGQLNSKMWEQVFVNPDSAITLGKEILKQGTESDSIFLAKTLAQIGVAYDIKGLPEVALPYFHQAIKIQEKYKDSTGLSFSYNNLGLMYYAQYDYPSALNNLRKSLAIDKAILDFESAAGSTINIGIIYSYLDSLDKSVNYYSEAISLYKKTNNKKGEISALANIGKVYYSQKKYTDAINAIKKVENYYQNNEVSPEELSSCYNSLANIYLKLKNYKQAINYAKKDLSLCEKYHLSRKKQYAYEVLASIYFTQKKYKEAYEYNNKFTILRDSMLNENRDAILKEIQVKYDTEKTKNELLETKIEKEKSDIKHHKEKQLFYVVFLFSILISIVLYAMYKSKQKINKLLKEKNTLNELVIEQKELMMEEVHHRVKNNLQLISAIIDLESEDFSDEKTIIFLKDLQNRIITLAKLHQFLYEGENVDQVNAATYINGILNALKESTKTKIFFTTDVPEININTKTAVPIGLIVNELVTNSIKYAFQDIISAEVTVQLKKIDNKLYLTISDNGIGISHKEQLNHSFGMEMIKSLCRQLRAKWEMETDKGLKHHFIISKFEVYE